MEEALEVLDELMLVNGTIPDAVKYKAEVLDGLSRYDEAVSEMEKLIRIYPTNKEYLHTAAVYAKKSGNEQQAVGYYQRILELDPTDSKANLGVAGTYRETGEGEEYLRSIRPLIENPAIELDAKINE